MSGKKRFQKPGSLQPNIDDILEWSKLPEDAFDPASSQEKADFIKDRKSVSYWADAWRRLRRNKVAMVALGIIIALVIFGFVGPSVVPYTYKQQVRGSEALHPWHYTLEDQEKINAYMEEHNNTENLTPDEAVEKAKAEAEAEGKELSRIEESKIRAKASVSQQKESEEHVTEAEAAKALGIKHKAFGYSTQELQKKADGEKVFPHVFGTDDQGRDIMVRVMVGTRISIIVGVCAAIIVLIIGALYGSISGYCGGVVDTVMQRIVEVINSIPTLVIATLMLVILKPGIIPILFVLVLTGWIGMSRIARAQMLKLKEQEFVLASKTLGASDMHIIFKDILPNIFGQLIIMSMFSIPNAIFMETTLSFVGLGIPAPNVSLGVMISDGFKSFMISPYMTIIPATILAILMLSFNLLADGLKDAFDPKMKEM